MSASGQGISKPTLTKRHFKNVHRINTSSLACLLSLSLPSLSRVRSQTNLSTSARRSELLRGSQPTPPCDDTSSRWRAPLLPEAAMMPPPVDDDDGEGRSADARPELALVLVLKPPLLPLTRMGLR